MKKIGVISDPHSNITALEAVVEDMPEVDRIICAGDLVGFGPQPNELVELIKSEDILSVLGNHDHAVVEEKYSSLGDRAERVARWTRAKLKEDNFDFLKKLNTIEELVEEDYEIFLAHGSPRNPLKEYIRPGVSNKALVKMTQEADSDIIVLGHTHVSLKRMIQKKMVLNPGSVGQPRDKNPNASYMILELGNEIEVSNERVEYDINKVEEKTKRFGLPEKFAIRLHFGW